MTIPIKMFAMVTSQGTAMSETALCSEHYVEPYIGFARIAGDGADDIGTDKTFHDCTDNDELVCVECGVSTPEQEWLVTFTKQVTARTYAEAVSRADDGKGGGNWEARPETDPIRAYHRKAAEAGLEVMGHVLDVVWDRVVDDDGMVAVVGRLTPQRITTLYEEFVGPMIDVLESWVEGMATSWRENHCSAEHCDEPLDGDSYDGLCGTHADQAEKAGKWS